MGRRTIDIEIIMPRRTADAFEESKHPRQGGKFASGSSSPGKKGTITGVPSGPGKLWRIGNKHGTSEYHRGTFEEAWAKAKKKHGDDGGVALA